MILFCIYAVMLLSCASFAFALDVAFSDVWSYEVLGERILSAGNKAFILIVVVLIAVAVSFFASKLFYRAVNFAASQLPDVKLSVMIGKVKMLFDCHVTAFLHIVKWILPLAIAALSIFSFIDGKTVEARWFEKHTLVAHGGGSVKGIPYQDGVTNLLEAFNQNYDAGHRVFEGDMCFTSDGILVLEHDWEHYYTRQMSTAYSGNAPTYAEYMSSKLYGLYTPMDMDDVVDFLLAHEDAYFMTDFKDCLNKELTLSGFQQIVDAAERSGHIEVLDRFIVQAYHYEFKQWVEEVYPFSEYLYTCYMTPQADLTPSEIAEYCYENNIPVITMWTYWLDESWCEDAERYGIKIFVHTENDLSEAERLISAGASGVYTDNIHPSDIANAQD